MLSYAKPARTKRERLEAFIEVGSRIRRPEADVETLVSVLESVLPSIPDSDRALFRLSTLVLGFEARAREVAAGKVDEPQIERMIDLVLSDLEEKAK